MKSTKSVKKTRGQYLLKASWDSKKVVDPEARKHVFSFLNLADADEVDCDPAVLVGRVFRVVDADDSRLYLEEVQVGRTRRSA